MVPAQALLLRPPLEQLAGFMKYAPRRETKEKMENRSYKKQLKELSIFSLGISQRVY